ncbi:hypothetical protein NDI39_04745 [Microcoleus sp. ZQ-A2]|nr:hypothetical protein [Microcoleus sp. FACHB-1]
MAFHLLCRHYGCFHGSGCLEFDAVAVDVKVRSRPLILGIAKRDSVPWDTSMSQLTPRRELKFRLKAKTR